jgi:phosphoribosyl 1,2-cyclic phosphodiesterase
MKIRFWGVRGSIPVPGPGTTEFGGNTSCVSVEAGGNVLIFDAGTGIRCCGDFLMQRGGPVEASIFITHTHWDHIQGFPFFVPAYLGGNRFTIYGPPSDVDAASIERIMAMQTRYEYFPVRIDELKAQIDYVDVREEALGVDGLSISVCRLNHPVTSLAYRLEYEGRVFVYGGDHEPFRNIYRDASGDSAMDEGMLEELDRDIGDQNQRIVNFCSGADAVRWDAQYTAEAYARHLGWGHSSHDAAFDLAVAAGVKHMLFCHHDPAARDSRIADLENEWRARAAEKGFRLDFAREGMEIDI